MGRWASVLPLRGNGWVAGNEDGFVVCGKGGGARFFFGLFEGFLLGLAPGEVDRGGELGPMTVKGKVGDGG